MFAQTYHTPLGKLTIIEDHGAITHLGFAASPKLPAGAVANETALLKEANHQLTEYFAGRRRQFDLPLAPQGTPFQQKVWTALQKIPYGETVSYQDIARQVDNPLGCRAVGMANNKNPIAIVIPCHRVVGKNGKLVGYAGGLSIKEFLLGLEKTNV